MILESSLAAGGILLLTVLAMICKRGKAQPQQRREPQAKPQVAKPRKELLPEQEKKEEKKQGGKAMSFKALKKKAATKKKSRVCKADPPSELFSFAIRGFSDTICDLKCLEIQEFGIQFATIAVQDASLRIALITSLNEKPQTFQFDFKDIYTSHVAACLVGERLDILIGTDESQKVRKTSFSLKTRKFAPISDSIGQELHKHQYLSLDILPNLPEYYLTCGSDQDTTIKFWKGVEQKTKLDTKKWKHHAYAREGTLFALGTWGSEVVVYTIGSDLSIQKAAILAAHKGEVRNLAFSSDGNYLVTASIDKTLKLWALKPSSMLHSMDLRPSLVAIEHLKDKRSAAPESLLDLKLLVAAAEANGMVRAWRVAPQSGKEELIAEIPEAAAEDIKFLKFYLDWDAKQAVLLVSALDGRINAFSLKGVF